MSYPNEHRFLVDPSERPWRTWALEGEGEIRVQVYLDGSDGGPEAIRGRWLDGTTAAPHFHITAQFQLILGGTIVFPDKQLEAPAVHYTDQNVPYGPFKAQDGLDILVLHAKPGGLIKMPEAGEPRRARVRGRELTGSAFDLDWRSTPGHDTTRYALFSEADGVNAEVVSLPPDAEFLAPAPILGRYEVILDGSVTIGGKPLGRFGLRFTEGRRRPLPLRAGSDGAILVAMTYGEEEVDSRDDATMRGMLAYVE